MKEFIVGFSYEVVGKSVIKANSAEEAEIKLYNRLSEDGLDHLDYRETDRDYTTVCMEEIKKD